ncbi:adenylate kinase [Agrobacterium vitis]|uniref:Adenylate kinase n=1 Tax=Agrobacterium vitis TaxID=373 RepID=A0AAE2USS4_AGRVI|nr:adenylate kinase [Agrobacterium vitis]MBF2716343.1 adenylate kinase [Agrobacterium vitis]MUZ63282.1 adenylate kinase [Agrobacterium vitis]MVA21180.1 adenylate kinase [Agrobacterium vitis]
MSRIVILGNAGGGKSTLARKLGEKRGLPHVEIDRFLWQEGWILTPPDVYALKHEKIISEDAWVIDGLGSLDSIPSRVERATEIILIDMALWMHFWLAAERQMAWMAGKLEHAPGGFSAMPPTRELFRTIWDVDQGWMPTIRELCAEAKLQGKPLVQLSSLDELNAFANDI